LQHWRHPLIAMEWLLVVVLMFQKLSCYESITCFNHIDLEIILPVITANKTVKMKIAQKKCSKDDTVTQKSSYNARFSSKLGILMQSHFDFWTNSVRNEYINNILQVWTLIYKSGSQIETMTTHGS
jgi:hypothetical protein